MSPEPVIAPEISSGFVAGLNSLAALFQDKVGPSKLPAPTPPVVDVKPAPSPPLRVSEGVQAARLISGPKPAYPPLAKAARIQGIVKMQALIARDGAVRNLQATSGPPLLIKAALEAVRQWRYQPTSLSGTAVEVETEIEVIFTLN
jgi:protein TonB